MVLVLLITEFNVLLILGFHPIVAGLYGIDQRFLLSVHCAGFRNLDFQITTVETQKSICLKQIMEAADCDHLKDKPVRMPIIARVLIHVGRTTFGAFSFLHGNLLPTTLMNVLDYLSWVGWFYFCYFWKIVCLAIVFVNLLFGQLLDLILQLRFFLSNPLMDFRT